VLEQIQAVPGVENAGIIGDLFIANSRIRSSPSKGTTERCPSACDYEKTNGDRNPRPVVAALGDGST
jgi:hypothetical protein